LSQSHLQNTPSCRQILDAHLLNADLAQLTETLAFIAFENQKLPQLPGMSHLLNAYFSVQADSDPARLHQHVLDSCSKHALDKVQLAQITRAQCSLEQRR
jgi:hypothetical protein